MPTDQAKITSLHEYTGWLAAEATETVHSAECVPQANGPRQTKTLTDVFSEMLDVVGLLVHFQDMPTLDRNTKGRIALSLRSALVRRQADRRKQGGRAGRLLTVVHNELWRHIGDGKTIDSAGHVVGRDPLRIAAPTPRPLPEVKDSTVATEVPDAASAPAPISPNV